MKAALRWLVRWARRAGMRDFYSALAALVSSVQNIFPVCTLSIKCPYNPATLAGSRAAPPVS
jgi:hypothetical protein